MSVLDAAEIEVAIVVMDIADDRVESMWHESVEHELELFRDVEVDMVGNVENSWRGVGGKMEESWHP